MSSQRIFFHLLLVAFLISAGSSKTAKAEGFTSLTGPLPIGAGGTESLRILPQTATGQSGAVGVGLSGPVANLEVKRGVKIGRDESFSAVGSSCDKAGTLSYDSSTKTLSFCNGTTWSALSTP